MRCATLCSIGLVLAVGFTRDLPAAEKARGTQVSLDSWQSRTPADWKEEAPQGSLRLKQFAIPGGKDDKADAELVIFQAGGGARANIERWKGQWSAPDGKKLADVATVREIKIGGKTASLLEVEGTYKTAPFDPKHKGKTLPGYRMLAVYLEGPENPYQIKFYGPAKTVDQHKKDFENWLQGFK